MSVYELPVDSDVITTVINALIGGSAEPVGETNIDNIKFERQKTEEELIYWLIDDIYRCFEKKNVYWESGRDAGKRAETFLQELYETIGEYLGIERKEE